MAKLKGISISLAAKCQLLFGLAVLVIIAGALAVPWQRMEQLAKTPNIKAARFAADMVFRQVHAGMLTLDELSGPENSDTLPSLPGSATAGSQPGTTQGRAPGTQPGTGPVTQPDAMKWNDASLVDGDYPAPRMYVVSSPTGGFRPGTGGAEDAFAVKALRAFRDKPQDMEFGGMLTALDTGGESARFYQYAAAIRVQASCIRCHGEFAEWMKGGGVAGGGTQAATTRFALPATMPGGAGGGTVAATGAGDGGSAGGSGGSGGGGGTVVGVVRVDVPYQTDENQLLLNRIVIVVAGMLGGALAIVVFYLITSRLILQPVRVLKNTAEKVSKGDLNIRSAISTGDEFQQLSETFNAMLATLKASQDQLEATNRSLDTRVGELAQSNVDLYEANRLKSEFLTNVSHELRTPLNAIIGFADLTAETAKDPKQQRYSENIRASAKQLLDLINDLLDLAKIEAGKLVLREEKVNVADVCEALANFMRPLAQKKNISLELSIDPEMPLIMTDPGRFQQILYNFLSNAIKFTPTDGRVTISAHAEPLAGAGTVVGTSAGGAASSGQGVPAAIRIAITDTGPGISVEDQKVIFEKFRQIDGSVTRLHSGSGLGLAISRELANMLGGRIELHSVAGKGATFSLVIPVSHAQRDVAVHAVLENA